MELLEKQISEGLQKDGQCLIPPGEIRRVWPVPEAEREAKVNEFVKQRGWHVFHYSRALGAIITQR